MFSCACSLRSTQCAALIALATAAGISRFEGERTAEAADPAGGQPRAGQSAEFVSARVTNETAAAFGRWLAGRDDRGLLEVRCLRSSLTISHFVLAELGEAASPLPRLSLAPLDYFAEDGPPCGATEQNRLPYAVGPPRRETPSNQRVVGTVVPGDFAARRSESGSRIAHREKLSRLARHSRPSWNTAGEKPQPGCGPRLFPT